jgi:uncharacterized protein involved in outer membrane biogenesis
LVARESAGDGGSLGEGGGAVVSRRRLRLALTTAAACLGALLALGFLAPRVLASAGAQAWLRAELSRRLGRPVTFDRLALAWEPLPTLRVTRLGVGSPRGGVPGLLVELDEVMLRLRLEPLRRLGLGVGELVLERPRVLVVQQASGEWDLPAGSALRAARLPLALISRVRLRGGRVEVRAAGPGPRPTDLGMEDIELALDDLGRSTPIRVHLTAALAGGGVRLELAGTAGPVAAARGDPAALPVQLGLRLDAGERVGPGGPASWLRGVGGGVLRVDGRLGDLAGGGRLAFAQVSVTHQPPGCPLPAPRTLVLEDVELPVRLAGASVVLHPFALRVAGGSVGGRAVLRWSLARPDLQLTDVRIHGVAIERVMVDYLCHPLAVTGQLSGSGALTLAGAHADWRRTVEGAWRLNLGPGRLVGAAALALAESLVRAGRPQARAPGGPFPPTVPGPLDFERLAATGTVESGEVRAEEIRWTGSRARVVGAGRYDLVGAHLALRLAVEAGRSTVTVRVTGPVWNPERLAVEHAGEP